MSHSKPPGSPLQDQKALVRVQMRQRMEVLTPDQLGRESAVICESLVTLTSSREFSVVLAYLPEAHEPDLLDFLQHCLNQGRKVAFPRLEPGRMLSFREVTHLEGPWERHRWGVRQPESHAPHWKAGEPTLVLAPGLAFAPGGARLGRGGGFFDQFLALHPELRAWGVAFSCQVVEQLPCEPHDQLLDGLILGGDSSILHSGGHLWD